MYVYVDKMFHANKKLFLKLRTYVVIQNIYIEHYYRVGAKFVTLILFLICNGHDTPLNSVIKSNSLDSKA